MNFFKYNFCMLSLFKSIQGTNAHTRQNSLCLYKYHSNYVHAFNNLKMLITSSLQIYSVIIHSLLHIK